METIGLSINDMESLIVTLKEELNKGQEENFQANTAHFISAGYTEDDARFKAVVIRLQAVDASAILGIIVANNRRILLDLKEAGIIRK